MRHRTQSNRKDGSSGLDSPDSGRSSRAKHSDSCSSDSALGMAVLGGGKIESVKNDSNFNKHDGVDVNLNSRFTANQTIPILNVVTSNDHLIQPIDAEMNLNNLESVNTAVQLKTDNINAEITTEASSSETTINFCPQTRRQRLRSLPNRGQFVLKFCPSNVGSNSSGSDRIAGGSIEGYYVNLREDLQNLSISFSRF